MPEPTIIQVGKYQVARVSLHGRDDLVGIREGSHLPWSMLGTRNEISEVLNGYETVWTPTRTNLLRRPTPIMVSDWNSPAGVTLDSEFTRRPGVPVLRRDSSGFFAGTFIAGMLIYGDTSDLLSASVPVTPGLTYTGSVYACATSPTFVATVHCYWIYETGASTPVGANLPGATGGEWYRFGATFTAPENAAGVIFNFIIRTDDKVDGGTGWITDGLVEQSDSILPWFSGDTPNTETESYEWEGTPNESISTQSLLTSVGEDIGKWVDRYGYFRGHSSIKGADDRGFLVPDKDSDRPRDLFSGIGGTGFDIRFDSISDREALLSAVQNLDWDIMIPVDADASELSKGVDYGRAE